MGDERHEEEDRGPGVGALQPFWPEEQPPSSSRQPGRGHRLPVELVLRWIFWLPPRHRCWKEPLNTDSKGKVCCKTQTPSQKAPTAEATYPTAAQPLE